MALPATHIRFALALEKKLGVSDHTAYIAGTLYPDSRYITGIDRGVTHDPQLLEVLRDKTSNDFEKGWAVHLMCDTLQEEERDKHFAHNLPPRGTVEWWTNISAMKIIADMNDAAAFNVHNEVACFTGIWTPNNEKPDQMKNYFSINTSTYPKGKQPTMENYRYFWNSLALAVQGKEVMDQVFEKAELMLKDQTMVSTLNNMFEPMIKKSERYL